MKLSARRVILIAMVLVIAFIFVKSWGSALSEPNGSSLRNVKESLKDLQVYDDLTMFELKSGNYVDLLIYSECELTDTDISGKFRELGERVSEISGEEWFTYKHVYLNTWNKEGGLLSSMEITAPDMSIRSHVWYEDEAEKETK